MDTADDKRQALFDLIKQVAAHLPKEWRFNQFAEDEQKENPELIGENGAKVYFRYRRDKPTMVNVTGCWPKIPGDSRYIGVSDWGVMDSNDHYPAMNFSVSRQPTAIATDLKRRFLENYKRLYLLCVEQRQKTIDHRELISHKVAAMERVAPVERCVHRHNPDNPRLYLQYKVQDGPSGEIYFNSQSTCDLKLTHVPFDTVIKVLATIDQDVTKYTQGS